MGTNGVSPCSPYNSAYQYLVFGINKTGLMVILIIASDSAQPMMSYILAVGLPYSANRSSSYCGFHYKVNCKIKHLFAANLTSATACCTVLAMACFRSCIPFRMQLLVCDGNYEASVA